VQASHRSARRRPGFISARSIERVPVEVSIGLEKVCEFYDDARAEVAREAKLPERDLRAAAEVQEGR
jgi:hypothetical protein